MKNQWRMMAIVIFGCIMAGGAIAEELAPQTFCRYVPERQDDFAWENDKVAFRMYGPALREKEEDSGIDCWLKRVDYPIVNKWYRQSKEGMPYHTDYGEGHDSYKVGSSRGCGGLGLWIDGNLVISDTYLTWEVIQCEPEESVFVLSYEYKVGDDTYTEDKQISIQMGDQLFKSTSTFKKNGEIVEGLPIAAGLRLANNHEVSKNLEEGWMATWGNNKGYALGLGVVMDPERIVEFLEQHTGENYGDHVLLITKTDENGQVEYYAGFGWERAGEITTAEQWDAYLSAFAEQH